MLSRLRGKVERSREKEEREREQGEDRDRKLEEVTEKERSWDGMCLKGKVGFFFSSWFSLLRNGKK